MEQSQILICNGTSCTTSNGSKLIEVLLQELEYKGLKDTIPVIPTGCQGLCAKGPVITVYPASKVYTEVTEDDISGIIEDIIKGCRINE